MPTFIKPGFWEKKQKGYDHWLNLDQFVEKIIEANPVPIGNFIPLTGTEVGSPVTGDIDVNDQVFIGHTDGDFSSYVGLNYTEDNGIVVNDDYSNKGLHGSTYYGANYDDNTYVQKQYVDNANSYSTTETLTGGTWIDGKPIYRNVIPFTIVGAVLILDISSLNKEVVLKKEVQILSVDGNYITNFVQYNGSPGQIVMLDTSLAPDVQEISINSYELTVATGVTTAYTPNRPGYLILEYTKTTD
jgi:hypothetical protein